MKRRRVWIGIAIAAVIVLVIAVPLAMRLWGGGFMGHGFWTVRGRGVPFDMHSWRGAPMGRIGMHGGGFFGPLVLAGVAWLIATAWRKRDTLLGPEDKPDDAALEILKLRLVNGEISPEEYASIKETLQS